MEPFKLSPACTDAPTVDAFYDQLAAHDVHFDALRQAAAASGRVLRALAVVDVLAGTAGLSVEAVGPDHPAFALDAGDNLVTFRTDRYPERPLVVRGPGAGAEVTAAGVFAELVQIGGMIRG